MAWIKNPTVTATVSNESLRGSFYYENGGLVCDVSVSSDFGDGPPERTTVVLSASSLTTQERTDLINLLKKVRDDALTALGYTSA